MAIVGLGNCEGLLGLRLAFVKYAALLLLQHGTGSLPQSLVPEEDEVVVHLDGGQEDGVLQRMAEIGEQNLQFLVIRILELIIPLGNIIQLNGYDAEQVLSQLVSNLVFTVAVLQAVDLHIQNLVVSAVALHIADGVVDKSLLDVSCGFHLLPREHGDHVGDDFAVEVGDEL